MERTEMLREQEGELLLAQCLMAIEGPRVFNVAIKISGDRELFFEMDCIMYYRGVLFCIMNKHYKGKVQLRALKYPIIVYKRVGHIRTPFIKSVFGGWDAEKLHLDYEEEVKSFKNPMIELDKSINYFKDYLRTVNKDFTTVPIIGLLCFSNEEIELGEVLEAEPYVVTLSNIVEKMKDMTCEKGQNEAWIEAYVRDLPTKTSIKA